jgi:hypothetical protein
MVNHTKILCGGLVFVMSRRLVVKILLPLVVLHREIRFVVYPIFATGLCSSYGFRSHDVRSMIASDYCKTRSPILKFQLNFNNICNIFGYVVLFRSMIFLRFWAAYYFGLRVQWGLNPWYYECKSRCLPLYCRYYIYFESFKFLLTKINKLEV